MNINTAGRSATLRAPAVKPAELMARLVQHGLDGGPVKAVKSNYGSVCQPGHEELLTQKKTKPLPMAPAGHKQRQREGNGSSFGSSVAPVVIPDPGSPVHARLVALDEKHRGRKYTGLYFPTVGSVRFSGAILPDSSDGDYVIDEWVRFMNSSNILGGPAEVVSRDLFLVNANFVLRKWCDRQVFDFGNMRRLLIAHAPRYFPAGMTIQESQVQLRSGCPSGSFIISDPAWPNRHNSVKMHMVSGKVNFMGFPSTAMIAQVHDALSRFVFDHWAEVVAIRPHPDSSPVPAAEAASMHAAVRACAARDIARAAAIPEAQKSAAGALVEALAAELAPDAEALSMMGEFAAYL